MCLHRYLDLIVFYLAGGSNADSVSNSIAHNCGVHCQCEKRCDAGFENETDEMDQILVSWTFLTFCMEKVILIRT